MRRLAAQFLLASFMSLTACFEAPTGSGRPTSTDSAVATGTSAGSAGMSATSGTATTGSGSSGTTGSTSTTSVTTGNGSSGAASASGSAGSSGSSGLAAGCADGVRNGDETDIDCGGSCPPCGDGAHCAAGPDCQSGVCSGDLCQAPSCTDGVQNGNESGVDCGGSCPRQPAPAGLVSWWRGEHDFADSVGGNAATAAGTVGFTQGEVGEALIFDTTDYLSAPTRGLPVGSADRTMELWVRVDQAPATEAFFAGYGAFGSNGQTWQLGSVGMEPYFSQWGFDIRGGLLTLGQWSHVAAVTSGSSAALYVDGTLVARGTMSINTSTGSELYMGRLPGALGDSRNLAGAIDEVSVYDRALTDAEIHALYSLGHAAKCE